MRRTALIILAVAAGLTALVLIAVAIAVATVDVRTLVGPVQARVKAETGRDLAFGGPLDLKLSLEPRLVAADVTLANAPWGQAPQMIRAKRVEVQVALLPLLQKRFEIVELALIEPVIALETDAQGRRNWDFGNAATAAPAPTSAAEAAGAGAVAFANVAIENGTLTYRDGATGKLTKVAIDRLAVHSRSGSAPVDAEFRGRVDDVAVAITGNLGPLDALRERRWPYPVAIKGEIDGKPASVSTKVGVQGDTTTLDALDFVWGRLAAKGEVRIVTAEGRRKYVFALQAPSWSLLEAAAVAGAATGAARPAPNEPASRFLFSERVLPLALLKQVDAEGALDIAAVTLNERNKLQRVKLRIALHAGKLDVPSFEAAAYGGTLSGHMTLDAVRAEAAAFSIKLDGRDLDLRAIFAAIGEPRDVHGGKTTIALELAGRGNSLHQWAASSTGHVLATVGPATLVNTRLDLGDVMDNLSRSVNPFRERDPSTEVVCAVARLPLANGIAKVDRSIAMQTKKLAVSASGTLDFRDEKLDLTLRPRINEGIPIDIPQIAELVRFSGPFAHPSVSVDALASAAVVAKIGAAIGTGGLSVLGTSLLAKATDAGNACDVALGRGAPAEKPAGTKAGEAPAQAVDNAIGKALGKLFGR